jgi:predicted oxidoreductase
MKTLMRWLGFRTIAGAWRLRAWVDRRREVQLQDFVNRACDQAVANLDWANAEAACRGQKEKQRNVRVIKTTTGTSV